MWSILQSTRPHTLALSVSSILTGTFLARSQGFFSWPVFILLLSTACLLQILSNLVNEWGDWKKGTDRNQPGRKALSLQSGKMTEKQLMTVIIVVAGLASISGLTLIRVALGAFTHTVPILFICLGAVALAAAVFYSAGRSPYGYRGGGDVSVFLFFGLTGVAGSYYLLAHSLDPDVLYIAGAMGMLITAVLNVNNIRDFENDKRYGKHTFAILLSHISGTGSTFPAKIYQLLLILFALVLSVMFAQRSGYGTFMFLISLPLLIVHLIWVRKRNGAALDGALKMLIAAIFVYALSLF